MSNRRIFLIMLCLLFGGIALSLFYKQPLSVYGDHNRPQYAQKTIFFKKKNGHHVSFAVEQAITDRQLAYGLMFKKKMPLDEGMLFIFTKAHQAQFWMKNTFIPLDIIFIKENGVISQIAQGKPHDLTPIRAAENVRYVLELNSGQAHNRGLQVGDRWLLRR